MNIEFFYTFVSLDMDTYRAGWFYDGSLFCYYSDVYQLLCLFHRIHAETVVLKHVYAEPGSDLDSYEKHSDAGTHGLYFGFRNFRLKINQTWFINLICALNLSLDQ